ncbi:MAG: nucleotide-binding protein [Chloroflexi bacterium]|nr:nucleotide-binding protein [Chloroflexota bacterium]
MGKSPASSQFRDLVTAAAKYKFTKGNFNSEIIELEPLGEQLTKPRNAEEHLPALRQAMRNIPLFEQILTHFNNSKLPAPEFLRNTLEREPFTIPHDWAQEVAEILTLNGREVGFIRVISGSTWVTLEAGPPTDSTTPANVSVEESAQPLVSAPPGEPFRPEAATGDGAVSGRSVNQPRAGGGSTADVAPSTNEARPESRQFFVAHRWDKDALQQVQNILNRFHIPYVVAQDEPNVGRPISQEIRELMKSCTAGIFIFSADEEFRDKGGNSIWRPRENVIYELGAASLEYGQRIVIFKEKGVYFPTDFRDLGFIEYEKGNLSAKAMELFDGVG